MPATSAQHIIDLETRFWQAMVDHEIDVALGLLTEPAVMVSGHGALQFNRADYRRMADHGPMVVKSFRFSDMRVVFPNDDTAVLTYQVQQGIAPRGERATVHQDMLDSSTWVRMPEGWQCVLHTETPKAAH